MSKTICFDLETSDLNRVGQILQIAAVCYDHEKAINLPENKQYEFSGFTDNIRIERTQLPAPEAILANRIDAMEHNYRYYNNKDRSEQSVLKRFKDWVDQIAANSSEPVVMYGYNIVKFDLPYLRTSMIRNGINPYFKNVVYSDLMFLVQKASMISSNIWQKLFLEANHNIITQDSKFNLRLQTAYKVFVDQNYKQTHQADDDVFDTIRLSIALHKKYGLDISKDLTYEPQDNEDFEFRVRPSYKITDSVSLSENNYFDLRPMYKIDQNKGYSLWVDLIEFKEKTNGTYTNNWLKNPDWGAGEGKSTIHWYNKKFGPFFKIPIEQVRQQNLLEKQHKIKEQELIEIVSHADKLKRFHNLKNFFPEKNCYIMSHIYMMDLDDMEPLSRAIWDGDIDKLAKCKSKYASQLYFHWLFNNDPYNGTNKLINQKFQEYCKYRYLGKMKIDKIDTTREYDEEIYQEGFHWLFEEQINKISRMLARMTPYEKLSDSDYILIEKLREFYLRTAVCRAIES